MIVAKFADGCSAVAYGLTQWDYGQELAIEYAGVQIPDGTEVNFYQGKLSSLGYLKSSHTMVPDLMLQNAEDLTAYVYVREENKGETILSVKLPVCLRPRPDNYVLPEYKDYKRLLPSGGEPGQSLVKKSEEDFDTEWNDGIGMEAMTNDEVDAIFEE